MPAQRTYLAVGATSALALVAVYLAVILGEFVAGGGFATRILGPVALPPVIVSLLIHTVITVPAACGVGYGLVRFATAIGLKAVMLVVLLWTTLVVVFQLVVYEPRVVALSVLKVVCVVAPLLVGSLVAQRKHGGMPHASAR
jgi:hypothetical protein